MPRYVFSHIDLCGVLGLKTPECPGTDYGLLCVITAPTKDDALEWGYRVHGDYMRARTAFTTSPHDGSPIRLGDLSDDSEGEIVSMLAEGADIAVCNAGEYPAWVEPWKSDTADGVRKADS